MKELIEFRYYRPNESRNSGDGRRVIVSFKDNDLKVFLMGNVSNRRLAVLDEFSQNIVANGSKLFQDKQAYDDWYDLNKNYQYQAGLAYVRQIRDSVEPLIYSYKSSQVPRKVIALPQLQVISGTRLDYGHNEGLSELFKMRAEALHVGEENVYDELTKIINRLVEIKLILKRHRGE